jgi:cytidylate kinase
MAASLDPHRYLESIIARDFHPASRQRGAGLPEPTPLVITISRDYGAGGGEIARRLSDCLGIPVHDQDILERVAMQAKIAACHFKPHDENVAAGVSSFVYSLLTGTGGHLESYRHYLYAVILDLARQDCILMGRGAHLILKNHRCFRLRTVGSRESCARRIALRFDIASGEAERRVMEINDKRHKSILKLFGDDLSHASLNHAANFDLIFNTDHLTTEDWLPVILLALQQAGFNLNRNGTLP